MNVSISYMCKGITTQGTKLLQKESTNISILEETAKINCSNPFIESINSYSGKYFSN